MGPRIRQIIWTEHAKSGALDGLDRLGGVELKRSNNLGSQTVLNGWTRWTGKLVRLVVAEASWARLNGLIGWVERDRQVGHASLDWMGQLSWA